MDVDWLDHAAPEKDQLSYLRVTYMVKKMIKFSRKRRFVDPDTKKFIPEHRILVHCSAGRGRTGTLIAMYCLVEHLLNLSETFFPGANPRETGFTEKRFEPDSFYADGCQPDGTV